MAITLLHQEKCGQQVEGGDSPPLLPSGETPPQPCGQLWGPQHRTDMELLERGQRRDTEMVQGLEQLCWGERLRELGGFSWRREGSRETLEWPPRTERGYRKGGRDS